MVDEAELEPYEKVRPKKYFGRFGSPEKKKVYNQNWDLISKVTGHSASSIEYDMILEEIREANKKKKKGVRPLGAIPIVGLPILLYDFLSEPGKEYKDALERRVLEKPENKRKIINIFKD